MTTEDLVAETNKEGSIYMLRGDPGFKFVNVEDEDGNYTAIQWEDLEARIIRPNLECTNGYIHVIDKVMMKNRDITLSKGHQSSVAKSPVTYLAAMLLSYIIVQ
jgi:uncharacterized surface protein with fasciclin (FAS1) repeats